MKDVMDGVEALLAGLPYAVYRVDVPESPDYPYVVLWAGADVSAPALDGDQRDLADQLGVTVVAETADAVWLAQSQVRSRLLGATPSASSVHMDELRLAPGLDIDVDRDVVVQRTNRHPLWLVDKYRLSGTTD